MSAPGQFARADATNYVLEAVLLTHYWQGCYVSARKRGLAAVRLHVR